MFSLRAQKMTYFHSLQKPICCLQFVRLVNWCLRRSDVILDKLTENKNSICGKGSSIKDIRCMHIYSSNVSLPSCWVLSCSPTIQSLSHSTSKQTSYVLGTPSYCKRPWLQPPWLPLVWINCVSSGDNCSLPK